MNSYQVIVSNVGTVYDGNDAKAAESAYEQYKQDSINVIGRAAGEDVTMMYKGEPCNEYIGVLAGASYDEQGDPTGPCLCPTCRIRTKLRATIAYALVQAVEDKHAREEHKDGALGFEVDRFITTIGKLEGIDIDNEQVSPMYDAIMNAIVCNSSGG